MSKKCKVIITSIMVVLYIILFSYNSTSNAMSVKRPFDTLFSNSNWWCTGKGIWLHNDWTYEAKWKIWKQVGWTWGTKADGSPGPVPKYDYAYDSSAQGIYTRRCYH